MKKLGIVGGVAWPSTIDYYRAICRLSLAHHEGQTAGGPPPTPEIAIESLNINKAYSLRGGTIDDDASWSRYDEYFRGALRRLEASGAGLALIASNTPHNRFDAITKGIGIPVLSLFEAIGVECKRQRIREMLILGTAPTMEAGIFPEVLARHGVKGSPPAAQQDRAQVTALISELYGEHSRNAAARVQVLVDASYPATGAPRTVCLACTELPLAFPQMERASQIAVGDVTYLNTTLIHAKAAFAALLQS
jgi:aspartate racemase